MKLRSLLALSLLLVGGEALDALDSMRFRFITCCGDCNSCDPRDPAELGEAGA